LTYFEPALPLLLLFGAVGLFRVWRRSIKGSRPWLLTISVIGIWLLSTNGVAYLCSLPLEIWYRDNPLPAESAEAIVILSGTVHSPLPNRPYAFAAQNTYERLQHGIWLYKNWNSLPILVCGGGWSNEPFSSTMKHVLETEGVPSELVWVESLSRSTHENAVYGSKILHKHGVSHIALVVEASSMPRAAASFRKLGINVVPAPFRFNELHRNLMDVLPGWQALATNGETIHELAGLAWYRLRGWI